MKTMARCCGSSPLSDRRFHRCSRSALERKPPAELKRPRPAGAEHLRGAIGGLAERRRVTEVVAVAAEVRDGEDVEGLDEHRQLVGALERERLRDADVL